MFLFIAGCNERLSVYLPSMATLFCGYGYLLTVFVWEYWDLLSVRCGKLADMSL